MIKRFFNVCKASIGLVRAFDLASKSRYPESLDVLESFEDIISGKDEEFHILRSFLLEKTGNHVKAIEDGEVAFDLIANNTKLNDSERSYLRLYLSKVCEKSYIALGKKYEAATLPYLNLNEIKLSEVSSSLKKNFPFAVTYPK